MVGVEDEQHLVAKYDRVVARLGARAGAAAFEAPGADRPHRLTAVVADPTMMARVHLCGRSRRLGQPRAPAAILISPSTTISGLLPILLETTTQTDGIKIPVVCVLFGLLTSTVLVVFVLPAFHAFLDDVGGNLHDEQSAP
ncbi:hypothetical protein [Sediminicurvatus halobius]|uniref:Uncharacterized protein n=1 Tax=Sediminicurvatus halobius TaxID=2182432 RepID=A0A2U2N293_9GAMM|nr:hypothetical protein [Spiribacter halobius]PWG63345.1 hypothetical protein DEM34_08525 [Spiribacter halobius]UEX79176.1 hypothetical protein LMH63_05920 [Spiribacter halobius]